MMWYHVGSRHELPHEAGLSHFLEHMMFKGTAAMGKGAVDHITTCLGGSNNAFTTADHTAYWFELASDRWQTALDIEADRMRGLLLEPKEFEAEKAVVLEELSMGMDDPWRRLSQSVQEMVFQRHTYARPVIGYEEALLAAGPEEMRTYYDRFYQPNNATLVVCGDINPSQALREIRKKLGALKRSQDPGPGAFRTLPPEPRGERRIQMAWDDPASRLVMGWPGAALGTQTDITFDIISTLLTGGRLSRMYRRLVLDRGLATSISTSNDARVETGAFWLYAEACAGVAPPDLESAIDEQLELLATTLISASELRRAKNLLSAGQAFEGETVTDLAENLGEYAVDADWPLFLELTERRRTVTRQDVRRVARELLTRERRVVGWSLPSGVNS